MGFFLCFTYIVVFFSFSKLPHFISYAFPSKVLLSYLASYAFKSSSSLVSEMDAARFYGTAKHGNIIPGKGNVSGHNPGRCLVVKVPNQADFYMPL